MAPSFYKVNIPFGFGEYNFIPGTILLFDYFCHTRVVQIASADLPTVYLNGFSAHSRELKQSLLNSNLIEPLSDKDLRRVYPHLTSRIKRNVADYQLKPEKPVVMCLDCGRRNNPRFDKNARPMVLKTDKCPLCKEVKPLSFTRLFGIHRLEGFR